MTDIELQKVGKSSLELSSIHILMINTHNFSDFSRSNFLSHLYNPSNNRHSEKIIG